tara:strand:+ start:4612 stop:5232 length:621 start_codon:yes stop_codon:yes gene_type:complete
MNKIENKKTNLQIIKDYIMNNIRNLVLIFSFIIILFISYQFYIFYKQKQILNTSIIYENSRSNTSEIEFEKNMNDIIKKKNFYSLLASMNLINKEIEKENYDYSYNLYLELLDKNSLNNLYKTIISIHGSYNLLDKIESNKIMNLLSFADDKLETFIGYHMEINYLLSLNNKEKSQELYNEIINNDKISQVIKERVNKINEFEKYK